MEQSRLNILKYSHSFLPAHVLKITTGRGRGRSYTIMSIIGNTVTLRSRDPWWRRLWWWIQDQWEALRYAR